MTTPPDLIVDFNDIDGERRVLLFLADKNKREKISLGREVSLRDDEGNRVRGVVAALRKGEALVDPDWSTWQARDAVR